MSTTEKRGLRTSNIVFLVCLGIIALGAAGRGLFNLGYKFGKSVQAIETEQATEQAEAYKVALVEVLAAIPDDRAPHYFVVCPTQFRVSKGHSREIDCESKADGLNILAFTTSYDADGRMTSIEFVPNK